jgi:signal peptidase II
VKRSLPLLLGVAGLGVAFDQWTKHWATRHLAYTEPIHVVDDLVRFTYTRNSGIAFGMFAGHQFPLYIFSIIAALAVLALFLRREQLSLARHLSLALILGGAVGNLIDRVTTGEVVDFILLSWGRHEFPVFNVADTCVTCGVVLFAFAWTGDPSPVTEAAHNDLTQAALPPDGLHGQDAGLDRTGAGRGPTGGPVAGEGGDPPVA